MSLYGLEFRLANGDVVVADVLFTTTDKAIAAIPLIKSIVSKNFGYSSELINELIADVSVKEFSKIDS